MIVLDRPGYGLAELDYVAEEIFIAAVVHGDPVLLRDVNEGDPYRRIAGWLFPSALQKGHEQLTDKEFAAHPRYKRLRKRAKVIALGIIYGMGDRSIAAKLQISELRARQLRGRFFERYSGLAEGINRAVRALEELGYAVTVTGQKRFRGTIGPLSSWERRWAVNTPVQGAPRAC
jgi:DNA polymerase-1